MWVVRGRTEKFSLYNSIFSLFLLPVLSAIYSVIPLYLFLVNFDLFIGRLIIPLANFFLINFRAVSKLFFMKISDLIDLRSNGFIWLCLIFIKLNFLSFNLLISDKWKLIFIFRFKELACFFSRL